MTTSAPQGPHWFADRTRAQAADNRGGGPMTAAPDPLGPTVGCSHGSRCEACGGGQRLAVATYQTPVGVLCATVCWPCVAVGNPPPVRSWGQACERVGAHCQHLGIDLDQMGALLAEHREGSG